MIDVYKLTGADIGRWVDYIPQGQSRKPQRGRIKRFTTQRIWVVFNTGGDWANYHKYTGEPCHPHDLVFVDADAPAASGYVAPLPLPQNQIVLLDAESFAKLAKDFRDKIASGEITIPADLQAKVDLIANIIPTNRDESFWAGFYTGILALSGAGKVALEEKVIKCPDDISAFGEMVSTAAVLAFNQQRATQFAEDDFFDRVQEIGD